MAPRLPAASWIRPWLRRSATSKSWRLHAIVVIACALLPILLFAWKAQRDRDTALADAEKELQASASAMEEHARATLRAYELVLFMLERYTSNRSWDQLRSSPGLRDTLSEIVRTRPEIANLTMMDASGWIQVSTFDVPSPPPNFADRDYFIRVRDGGEVTTVAERVHSRIFNGDSLVVARRHSAADGSFAGLILVDVQPSQAFAHFWDKASPGRLTSLVRDDGHFLVRNPKPVEVDLTQTRLVGPTFAAATSGAISVAVAPSPVDGIIRMTVFRKVEGYPVIVIHGVELDVILAPLRARLWVDAAIFGTVSIALSLLAMVLVRQGWRDAVHANALSREIARRTGAEAELHTLLVDTVRRQESDRRRVARDLHDSLGQQVALLSMKVRSIAKRSADPAATAWGPDLTRDIGEIGHQISHIAWELRPVWLDDLGLETALRTLAKIVAERSALTIEVETDLGGRRFGEDIESTVFRAVQEALTNVVKHAAATRVDIVVSAPGNVLRATIEDNGTGFQPANHVPDVPRGGLGLRGIQERLTMVGGSMEIESSPGEGSALSFAIPLRAMAA